ncbi:uncharacterized protein LOC136751351 [Amia ocellicauda]|uniref:uncharacterized protein LOC136751351 n=1 Tax=Amia ocellicauda TaxID=2972642 RepID=UPI003464E090
MTVNSAVLTVMYLFLRNQAQEIQFVNFKIGRDISLNCSCTTFNYAIYEKWNIRRTSGAECYVVLRFDMVETNTCNKSRITIQKKDERTFLHILHFEPHDAGIYTCEAVYNGGVDIVQFNVSALDALAGNVEERTVEEAGSVLLSASVINSSWKTVEWKYSVSNSSRLLAVLKISPNYMDKKVFAEDKRVQVCENGSLWIEGLRLIDSGEYTCSVVDLVGKMSKRTVVLTVSSQGVTWTMSGIMAISVAGGVVTVILLLAAVIMFIKHTRKRREMKGEAIYNNIPTFQSRHCNETKNSEDPVYENMLL